MTVSRESIWRLVQHCAEELTSAGHSPFTRRDLISCVQCRNPEYGADSINPIIQGMTNNLRGGAPGAIGKNILHSVARGQFVLLSGGKLESPVAKPRPIKGKVNPRVDSIRHLNSSESISLDGYIFLFACGIDPVRNQDGSIAEFMPQDRFRNEAGLPLNKYGVGPFCKFKIPNRLEVGGVYALLVAREVKYIGECQHLSSRYNMGYGNISPRNCFRGGQETNCRLNSLILGAVRGGAEITLWFNETSRYKEVERGLREKLRPGWNRA